MRVVLHGRNMRGFVTELLDEPAVARPRPVRSLVSDEALFAAGEIELARWAARRYIVPLGLVLHDAVPGRYSAPTKPGAVAPVPAAVARPSWLTADPGPDPSLVFPPGARDEPDLVAYLAARTAKGGGCSLVICPRVELVEAVAARIPGAAVLHGDQRPGDRAAAWAAARDGRVHVLVGGRAALFAPLPGLRRVVVCSAHDRSLKSERAPRIDALVVARERASRAGAALCISSPAPPLDAATPDRVTWLGTKRRHLRVEVTRPGPAAKQGPVTQRLLEVVRWSIGEGASALVFAARRGEALRLRCRDCAWSAVCRRCEAGLSLERSGTGDVTCRVCGEVQHLPDRCDSCGGMLAPSGWGHERIARALETAGVGAAILRVVAGSEIVTPPKPAVIVGTLAALGVARGVAAVCVPDLDQLLVRPEFRAAERALQTLHELSDVLAEGGRFLLQTREPDHHVVQSFTRQSYRYFFDREIGFRKETGYPPFGVVVRVDLAADAVGELRTAVEPAGASVIGALPSRGRVTALVRAPDLEPLLDPLRTFSASHARVKVDVDPSDVL